MRMTKPRDLDLQNAQTPPRSAHHYVAARSRTAQMAARARSGTRQASSSEQGEAPAGGIAPRRGAARAGLRPGC
jgi:hypothetical protein